MKVVKLADIKTTVMYNHHLQREVWVATVVGTETSPAPMQADGVTEERAVANLIALLGR